MLKSKLIKESTDNPLIDIVDKLRQHAILTDWQFSVISNNEKLNYIESIKNLTFERRIDLNRLLTDVQFAWMINESKNDKKL